MATHKIIRTLLPPPPPLLFSSTSMRLPNANTPPTLQSLQYLAPMSTSLRNVQGLQRPCVPSQAVLQLASQTIAIAIWCPCIPAQRLYGI